MVPPLSRPLPLPPELCERSRNVGEEEDEAHELRLVDGVIPKISCTVGRWYSVDMDSVNKAMTFCVEVMMLDMLILLTLLCLLHPLQATLTEHGPEQCCSEGPHPQQLRSGNLKYCKPLHLNIDKVQWLKILWMSPTLCWLFFMASGKTRIQVFWNVTLYCWVSGSLHFEGLHWHHLQGCTVHEGHFGLLTLPNECTAIPPPLKNKVSQCHNGEVNNVFTLLIWVIPVCYSKYSDNKHSQTHHSIYLFSTLCHYTLRLCQCTTCFGLAEPSSGTCINVTDGCRINHYISAGLSHSSSPLNGFIVYEKQWTGKVSIILLYYFYTILYYVIKDLGFNIYTCTWWWLGRAETCSTLAQP
jgi:hypothetical protein